jgi:hypothetical protein
MNPIIVFGLLALAIIFAIGAIIFVVEIIEEWGRGALRRAIAWFESLK